MNTGKPPPSALSGSPDTKKEILSSVAAFLAFYMKLDVSSTASGSSLFFSSLMNNLGSYRSFSMVYVFLIPMLLVLFRRIDSYAGQVKAGPSVKLPAVLFALFMLFGYSLSKTDSVDLVLCVGNGQIVKALIVGLGYYVWV